MPPVGIRGDSFIRGNKLFFWNLHHGLHGLARMKSQTNSLFPWRSWRLGGATLFF
jgi:hypothetical protein